MIVIAAALAACSEPGTPWACTCSFLTDFDDAAQHSVEVCAPAPERAELVARGCAQAGAPAPIQACACKPMESWSGEPTPGAASCRTGDCRPSSAPQ